MNAQTDLDEGASYLFSTSEALDESDLDQRYADGYRKARFKDKAWFERYPHRSYRLRKPTEAERKFLKAEPSVGGYPAMMLVVQVQPGFRERRLVYTALDSQTPEPAIAAFGRLMRRALEQGFCGEFDYDDLRAELGMPLEATRH